MKISIEDLVLRSAELITEFKGQTLNQPGHMFGAQWYRYLADELEEIVHQHQPHHINKQEILGLIDALRSAYSG